MQVAAVQRMAAELLTAVGALEGFVMDVKRAVVALEVFLAAEGWKMERGT
jgi:hypothetical protein